MKRSAVRDIVNAISMKPANSSFTVVATVAEPDRGKPAKRLWPKQLFPETIAVGTAKPFIYRFRAGRAARESGSNMENLPRGYSRSFFFSKVLTTTGVPMNTDERLRVLYIEDNCDSFEMLKVLLDMSDIELDSASSIGETLERVRSEKFDLYLLDSGLPDGNGLHLCRTLRADHPATPVLFYSGHAHPDEIRMGMEAGAHGYVIKPHSDKLAEIIIQLVATQRGKSFALKSLPVLSAAA